LLRGLALHLTQYQFLSGGSLRITPAMSAFSALPSV